MFKEPIRILNLFTIMNRGGAETMVMNYYRNIDRSKVQFDFMVHRSEKGAYDDEIEALGGRIYRMCPIYPSNFAIYKKMLKKFFFEHKEYKIIHSHMSELGYFALKEAKKSDIPVRICHAHNAPCGWDLKMFVRYYFKKNMMPYITHMFMCGKESGDWLFGKKNEQHFIQMNNAIDAAKFRYNKELEREVRRELGIENKFVLGHIGRFNKQKNHEYLIQIYKDFFKLNPNSVLVLVGEGDLKESVEVEVEKQGLRDHVLFLGARNDIDRIIQCFDSFVFPSLFEGFGIVLLEAQAAGVCCLTSDNIPRIADIGLCEFISLNEEPAVWAEKIRKNKKRDMYKVVVEKHFDIKENVKWLEEFYWNEYNK